MIRPHLFLKLLGVFLLLPSSGLAQRHHHEEHEHRNELALFLGATYDADEKESFFTIGGDYEFRFHPRVGISAEAEYVDGPNLGVFAFPVVFHVYRGLMVLGGPGFEQKGRHHREIRGQVHDEAKVEPEEEGSSFLIRVGVQYAFHIGGRVSILPTIDLDFVDGPENVETLLVFGVKIGLSF